MWASDIIYARTHEGWLYLAVVIDLFSRRGVGWSIQPSMHTDIVLSALTMAFGQRLPGPGLLQHSDRGSQYTSDTDPSAPANAQIARVVAALN